MKDIIEIGSELSVIRVDVKNPKLIGKTIIETDFRKKFGANIIAISRNGKTFIPTSNEVLQENDSLSIIINDQYMNQIGNYICGE